MSGSGYSRDPLDLARGQMDFARMAQDAPSVKSVLFKAQTIIPVTPAKPAWQKAAPIGGALVLAGLMFLPVLPAGSSLERINVSYEGEMTRSRAQEIQFAVRRSLESDVLMGTEFSASDEVGNGRLQLSFSASGDPVLESRVHRAVTAASEGLNPLFGPLSSPAEKQWRENVVRRVGGLLNGSAVELPAYYDKDNRTAQNLLAHPEMLSEGLNRILSSEGYTVSELHWLDRDPQQASEAAGYNVIELDCWPKALHIELENHNLSEFENAELAKLCGDWLAQLNLGPATRLSEQPSTELPIMVEVRGLDGRIDRLLTEQLQAVIVQPRGGEITDASTWQVRDAVEGPLHELLGKRECAVAYERVSDPGYNQDVNFFWVHVRLLNQFDDTPELSERVTELEKTIDF